MATAPKSPGGSQPRWQGGSRTTSSPSPVSRRRASGTPERRATRLEPSARKRTSTRPPRANGQPRMRSRMVGSAGMATAPDHGGWGGGPPLRPLPTDAPRRRSRPARPGRPDRPPRRGGAGPGPRHLHRAADRGRRHPRRPRHRRDPRGRAVALLDHLLLAAGARPLVLAGGRRALLGALEGLFTP